MIIMKYKQPLFLNNYYIRQMVPYIWFIVSLFVAILSGFFLFQHAVYDNLAAQIINTGFDPMRSQLIAALLLTLGTALIGTLFTTNKFGSILGAGIIFIVKYLLPFIQSEIPPTTDPGGNLELLNSGALVHTSCVIVALALLSAFIGSAIGLSLYEVLLELPYQLLHKAIQHIISKREIADQPTLVMKAQSKENRWHPARWAAIAIMIILCVLASQSTDLFFISPDVGLHNPPKLFSVTSTFSTVGTVKTIQMRSKIMGNRLRSFEIYFPPSYFDPKEKNRRYPTIYLLHGSPGLITDWVKAGDAANSANELISTKKIQELIMVMPDGNGAPGATSEWGNSANHKQPLESYVSDELVHYIDQHFRTIPNAAHRAIGGLSMGGFGAMNIAVHNPSIFNWVISLGGYYKATGTIWGSNIAYRRYNSAIIQIGLRPQARQLHIFLGDAYQDNPYYTDTVQYAQQLNRLGIKYTFVKEPGHHSWKIWATQLYQALKWLQWGPIHPAPKIVKKL
jgi:S-formylglutathione hydrolase FrmB